MDVATILQTIRYLSRKFPDYLEIFQSVRKVSRQSGKFPVGLESYQIVWKFSWQCGKFPDSVESFRTVWKLSRPSGKFTKIWKLSRQIFHCLQYWCNIHILHFCKKSFGTLAFMSRKRFTHFWHIYVAKAIYALLTHICCENDLRTPSGKFLRLKFCWPASFDFLCLCNSYCGRLPISIDCQHARTPSRAIYQIYKITSNKTITG